MATPAMTRQTGNKSVTQGNAAVLVFLVRDDEGAPVDISSGYGAKLVVRASREKDAFAAFLAQTSGFTFGATGILELALTAAQVNAMPVGRWPMECLVSNDGTPFATTQAVAHSGSIDVAPILQ